MSWKDFGINFHFMPTLVQKVEKHGVVIGCSHSNGIKSVMGVVRSQELVSEVAMDVWKGPLGGCIKASR